MTECILLENGVSLLGKELVRSLLVDLREARGTMGLSNPALECLPVAAQSNDFILSAELLAVFF